MFRPLCLFVCLILGGCASAPLLGALFTPTDDPRLLETSYEAADRLHDQLASSDTAAYPMMAASFVDSDNMDRTSNLGRLISEQIASRLSQRGYSITEAQLRATQLAVRPESGVLALSRQTEEINTGVSAYSILVGTYTVVERKIYVNARILRASDGVALASSDFVLPFIRQRQARPAESAPEARPSVGTRLSSGS